MSKFQGIFSRVGDLEAERSLPAQPNLNSASFSLDFIQPREHNTRPLKLEHVQALAESIAAISLLEPLVVDAKGRLLAGGHRLAAIHLLKESNPTAYTKHFPNDAVPVRVMDFDAEQHPDRALECEIAENEHRRDYTPAEVRTLANRLKEAGYIDRRGRPAEGEKALRPALQVIVGKSWRQVVRYLKPENMTDVIINQPNSSLVQLNRLQAELLRWQKHSPAATTPLQKRLAENVKATLRSLQLSIDQAKSHDT